MISNTDSHFDDRESFRAAEATLDVILKRSDRFSSCEAAWEAFINWRNKGETEYMRQIRSGGKFIFYSVLHDLYNFANDVCGDDVTVEIGEDLSGVLLENHIPDILQSILDQTDQLPEQILRLVKRFLDATTGQIYKLTAGDISPGKKLCLIVTYMSKQQMIDYLRRSGHEPERVFTNSFNVYTGALRVLLEKIVFGFCSEQLHASLYPLKAEFTIWGIPLTPVATTCSILELWRIIPKL